MLRTFEINNRRYLGNKFKLLPFIRRIVDEECNNVTSVLDAATIWLHSVGSHHRMLTSGGWRNCLTITTKLTLQGKTTICIRLSAIRISVQMFAEG